jgi:dephospho-CoA kinase
VTVRVGLTGGLASGKSTVARLLAGHGFRVVDADEVVAWLYESDRPGALAVGHLFGPAYLDTAGSVDRARLAERVFADPAARRRLEAAIHPLVARRFEDLAGGAEEAVVVLEATLLVEAGMADAFDLVVSVEAEDDGAARRQRADRVLVNDRDLAHLTRQVDALAAELRRRAGGGGGTP